MKKVMLGLVMVMMLMSLVGCGETKKEGFVPEQVTESEVVTDDVKENIEEVIDTENLQKYYDVEKYLGTPSYGEFRVQILKSSNTIKIHRVTEMGNFPIEIENNGQLENGKIYGCIICDNDTPNNADDDVVAYIFTTPIAE